MRWILRIGIGLFLALGLAVTALAATPDGRTAATAIPLSTSQSASGSLVGSAAGSYAYYTVDYPGDGSVGTVGLTISPTDAWIANAVGVTIYQAGNQITTSNVLGDVPGHKALTFSSTTRGPMLVLVYDYWPGTTVSYRLTLSGVSPFTTPTLPTSTPTPAFALPTRVASTPSGAVTLTTSASGTLQGNPAGQFAYYTLDYPGDGSPQRVNLEYSPGGVNVGNAIVLSVYQNGQTLASLDGSHAVAPGRLVVSYSSTMAGPVLIQIANYNPSPTISYTISR